MPISPKTNKPQIAQPAIAGLWLKTEEVQELRAMYPQARDEELAELCIYLNAFPDGLGYLRKNPNEFYYALQGTRIKSIAFTASFIESVPRETPATPTENTLLDGLPLNPPRDSADSAGR